MTARQISADSGMGVSFIFSAVIHMAVFLFVNWLGAFAPQNMRLQDTYYVDVVNLPVADPQAGSPAQKGNDSAQSPPTIHPESSMTLPVSPKPAAQIKPAMPAVKRSPAVSESSSFAKRMAKLEKKAEALAEEETLARLRNKLKTGGSGKSGMPTGSGKEAGSDYAAYIQSRLKDAFRETISYSSKNPEVVVRLIINIDGKISRSKTEKSSGDRAFEISALRAVDIAAEKFTPPPSNKTFEGVFVFRPQGISQDKP